MIESSGRVYIIEVTCNNNETCIPLECISSFHLELFSVDLPAEHVEVRNIWVVEDGDPCSCQISSGW